MNLCLAAWFGLKYMVAAQFRWWNDSLLLLLELCSCTFAKRLPLDDLLCEVLCRQFVVS